MLMLGQVAQRLQERQITLTWSEEVVVHLAKAGFDPKFGARPLRRLIQNTVEDDISEAIIAGKVSLTDTIHLVMVDGQVSVKKGSRAAAPALQEAPASVVG